jgi:pyruvate dehydrogenase E2 component (dihydrolipoamide acetyltransferase)
VVKIKFEFPDTGEGVTEGQFLEWKVEEEDEVEEDQVVGEAETDKAVVDIPAPSNGTVKELKASPGDNIEVGDVIMILDVEGSEQENNESNDVKEQQSEERQETDEVEIEPEEAEKEEQSATETELEGEVLALPKVRKLAEEKNVDLASIKTGERITEEEVLDAAEKDSGNREQQEADTEVQEDEAETRATEPEKESDQSDVLATPSVRKLAREKEIRIQNIEGSGRGGKVTREDVLNAAKDKKSDTGNRDKSDVIDIEGDERRVKMSQTRKTIADRMEKSRFTAPHVTHFDTADVTELVELREEKKDKTDTHLTYLPFIMKAVYLALKKHPRLNSELDEEEDSVVLKNHYDFNIAVDTDNGLMVPLVEDIDEKNILEIAEEVNRKAGEARNGELSQEKMRNGTFSITNLGVIGGEEFTPIINYPQTAILGIGKIQETAEVVGGKIEPRMTVKLSLSYDHRVIDGADAAKFMNDVIENLEDPENMILEL